MTVRQVVLQATVKGIVEKTEAGYAKVQTDLVQMRKAGDLPSGWASTTTRDGSASRSSLDDVEEALQETAQLHKRVPGQARLLRRGFVGEGCSRRRHLHDHGRVRRATHGGPRLCQLVVFAHRGRIHQQPRCSRPTSTISATGDVPADVEIRRPALPALSRVGSGCRIHEGEQRHEEGLSHPQRPSASGVEEAWRDVGASFERFCLTAGIATLAEMMERGCGGPVRPAATAETDGRRGHRWGQAAGKIGFHGGKVAIERPRVRSPRRPRVGAAELGGGPGRGLARPVGDEPDADQRVDAQVRARRSACRKATFRRPSRRRRIEVGGLAPVRGAVGGAHGASGWRPTCPSSTCW